jgi:hypothetical protein
MCPRVLAVIQSALHAQEARNWCSSLCHTLTGRCSARLSLSVSLSISSLALHWMHYDIQGLLSLSLSLWIAPLPSAGSNTAHVLCRLTFWVVYATLINGPIASVLSLLPLFYELKLAAMVYMLFFGGASTIYKLYELLQVSICRANECAHVLARVCLCLCLCLFLCLLSSLSITISFDANATPQHP